MQGTVAPEDIGELRDTDEPQAPQTGTGLAQAPVAIAAGVREAAAGGSLTGDDAKDALRAIDALAGSPAAQQACRDAAATVVETLRRADLLSRGHLVMQANLLARLGDARAAAGAVITACEEFAEGFSETHALTAWRQLAKRGADEARVFAEELGAAGVPLAVEGDTSALLAGLQKARGRGRLTEAIEHLERSGGFADVVAAGRALNIVRTAPGRSAEHVVRLTELTSATCGLTARVVNDALVVLAELGAADDSAALIEAAADAGVELTAEHRLSLVSALANAMRFDEALHAYQRYLDDGFPANARARRVQVQALCLTDRTAELRTALLDWATAVRDGGVGDPPASLLTTSLVALLRDDISVVLEVLRGTAGAFSYNDTHRKLVTESASRSQSLPTLSAALVALTTAGLPPTRSALERLVALTADLHPADVVGGLEPVVAAHRGSLRTLAAPLVVAQLAAGELPAAQRTARASADPQAVEAVVLAQIQADDLDAALATSEVLDVDDGGLGAKAAARKHMPHPPALVARIVWSLAGRRGPDAAEAWLRRYPQSAWPMEAWEALAGAYRRDGGKHRSIEWLVQRMRQRGRTPSGNVWAHWLSAFPRQRRAAHVTEALETMATDGVAPTPAFWTAAVVGALLPAKVRPQPDGDPADLAWENAREALRNGEGLLVSAVADLAPRLGSDPGSWFTRGQLLEIARGYPLRRRPYAQLDAAVEVRLAEEADRDEQFAAFLGAVAAAHGRALLPEGVRRIRAAAAPLGLADRPELVAALFDAAAGRPEDGLPVVRAELAAGTVCTPAVAQAAGRLLVASGTADAVLQVLDASGGDTLDRDLAEDLVSAAVLELGDAGQDDVARELGAAAETRRLSLTPTAQASLLTTHRPEQVAAADAGPVWTTAQLGAYNSLLEHELANHLRAISEDVDLLGDVVANLRGTVPSDAAPTVAGDIEVLQDVLASLRRTRGLQRRSLAKIAAAADLERTSAGVVPVLEAIDAVVDQLADEAAAAGSELRILDRAASARMAVRGHATLLQFALHNLVSNAVKAHRRRKDGARRDVEVLATFAESDREDLAVAPYGWVVLSVRDHGDGVPDDLPDNVANWSIPGQPGKGAGIGLRVTENMIRQSGGQLWIDTNVADGSRFCFRLPSAARRDARAIERSTREEENRG